MKRQTYFPDDIAQILAAIEDAAAIPTALATAFTDNPMMDIWYLGFRSALAAIAIATGIELPVGRFDEARLEAARSVSPDTLNIIIRNLRPNGRERP